MLSTDLYREVRPEFLRLLGSPAARVYLDVADEVEREAALRPDAMTREEAWLLAERVVERHGDVEIEESAEQTVRERARFVLERLITAGWLAADDRADYRRFVLVEPEAVMMLEALRKIARPGAAVFSDKLAGVCSTLMNSDALAAEPWQTIANCAEAVRHGVQELNSMAKSVTRHTRRQLEAQSLRENLAVIFDEYAGNVGHGAYAELIRSRLPTRLPEARGAVERLQNDAELLNKMAAELSRREGGELTTAMAHVRSHLRDLAQALDRVVPCADEVDRRTADFTRKSLARFRYLQEVTGEHRATVQAFFEKLNAHFAGRRVVDAEAEIAELPALLLTEIQLPAGLESLRFPGLRHALGEIEPLDDEPNDDARERAERQLAATLRDSLTVARANRFAADAFEQHGPSVPSSRLLRTDDDLAALIACLLHAGARDAKYRVVLPRELDLEKAAADHHDQRELEAVLAGTRRLERFDLVRK